MTDPPLSAGQSDEDRAIMPLFIACAVVVLLIVLTTWRYVAYQPRAAEGYVITPVARPIEEGKNAQPEKPVPPSEPARGTE